MKTCRKCNASKPLEQFRSRTKRHKTGTVTQYRYSWCGDCERQHNRSDEYRAKVKKWKTINSDKLRAYARRDVCKKYGLTTEQYQTMFEAQNGLCAICGNPETDIVQGSGAIRLLAVDHNHKTGRVRQLLCKACNTALGFLGEDAERVIAMLNYIKRHGDK